jgi:ATP-dependent Clp protease ATP-binding subunit ClpC
MFERFTDRARRVVVLAQEEARLLNHNYIGTEHILLGLLHEGDGIAARALDSLGVGLDRTRREVEAVVGRGERAPSGHIPFTPRAKKTMELSLREALQLGDNFIGPEHIMLGLLREGEGAAARVLVAQGTDLNRLRRQVTRLREAEGAEGGIEGVAPRRVVARPGLTSQGPGNAWQVEVLRLLTRIADRLDVVEQHLGSKGVPAEPGKPEADAPGDAQATGE